MASSGGVRIGAGRKPAPEPLKALTVRVPQSLRDWLKASGINQSKFFADAIAKARAEIDGRV